eukprot:scaffold36299_cov145-Isochrysis_galbana.AAC.2
MRLEPHYAQSVRCAVLKPVNVAVVLRRRAVEFPITHAGVLTKGVRENVDHAVHPGGAVLQGGAETLQGRRLYCRRSGVQHVLQHIERLLDLSPVVLLGGRVHEAEVFADVDVGRLTKHRTPRCQRVRSQKPLVQIRATPADPRKI